MKFILKTALMMLLTIPALASEPTHLVLLKESSETRSMITCLTAIKDVIYRQSAFEWIENMQIVTVGPLIVGVAVTDVGAAEISNLDCVAAVNQNTRVGTKPSIGRSN